MYTDDTKDGILPPCEILETMLIKAQFTRCDCDRDFPITTNGFCGIQCPHGAIVTKTLNCEK